MPPRWFAVKSLACNRRELNSSLPLPSYADVHTQLKKKAKRNNSYFINGASHKHSNYIFMIKSNYLFYKSGVGFEIYISWPPLTSATMEDRKKISNFIVEKGWCTFK